MRFKSLCFRAFGPFTGLELDLSGGAPGGLHVVYGRNEAGKSSALRGVHDLLFGIPERTGDDHVHRGPELRIAATLEHAGRTLEIQRLKRRKDSLRDARDEPLEEGALSEWLGGLDGAGFERLFGFDHERLRLAANAMLEGDADVGESLFDAGSGGSSIRHVLGKLEAEADALYKPRAHKVRISALLESYGQAKREAKERQNPPEKVHAQQARLAERQAELERVAVERRALRAELEEKTRLQSVLPALAQRGALLDKLAALGAGVDFSEAEDERRVQAERALLQAEQERDHHQRESARTRAQRDELAMPSSLTTLGKDVLTELDDLKGKHRAARADLPKLQARVAASELEAQNLLASVFPGMDLATAARRRPSDSDLRKLRRLAERRPHLTARETSVSRGLAEIGAERARVQVALGERPALPGLPELKRALTLARGAGDVDRRVRESATEAERVRARAAAEHASLGLYQGPLSGVLTLPVPADETLARFERELQAHAQRREALLVRRTEKAERLAHVLEQVAGIERVGKVPSEAELETARASRDRGWNDVRRAWQSGHAPDSDEPGSQEKTSRARAFELLQNAADAAADRLRREADRVLELAQRQAERHELERELTQLEAELSAADESARVCEQHYQLVWEPVRIRALSVAEMRAWLARQRKLAERVEALQVVERQAEDARSEQVAVAGELARALGLAAVDAGAWVTPLCLRCEDAFHAANERALSRAALEKELEELTRRRGEAERARAEVNDEQAVWAKQWRDAAESLGFEHQLSAEDAGDAVADLAGLFAKIDEVTLRRGRVEGIERDAAQFRSWALALAQEHAPDLAEAEPDALAEELQSRIHAAHVAHEQRERLSADLAGREQELAKILSRVATAEAELTALMRAAGAGDRNELRIVAERARQGRELTRQIEDLERQLLAAGGGHSLAALLAATHSATQADLLARSAEIKEDLERADEQHQDLSAEVRGLEAGLESFGGSEAAEQAQTVALYASELREHVRRYARLRIGAHVLRREIERYRAENQGPVLKRASALFAELTLGRYRGLRVGVEEHTLAAVRADARELAVPELSEGSRYQLYLALRLASLERYLDRNPALPLVLDDALIHFDDDRASSAFRVLGELAQRTQVLFFTHHARDVELSRRAVPSGIIFSHELDRVSGSHGEIVAGRRAPAGSP